jgi:hypothetical protein
MAEDHRILENEGSDSTLCPVVYITTTDSSIVYSNEDIVGGLDGRFWFFFEFYVEGFVEDEGEVL